MEQMQEKIKKSFIPLKEMFGWTNPMQGIKIEKVVISVGYGKVRKEKERLKLIQDRLSKITGQKPAIRKAKQSIAAFKLREGEDIGFITTLRGANRDAFMYKLINVAFPRTKDFRGLSVNSVDEMGNISIGIREHTVFPEVPDENLQDIFGFSITIVTSAKNKEEAVAFFKEIGMPFKKDAK